LIADSYNIKFQGSPTYYLPLLLKNDCGWKSVGVTHEYWYSPENKVKEILPNFSIWHKCNGDYRKRKFEKDAELLVEGLKQEPNNSRYMFYLAQSLKDCGQYEKAIQWYEKRISMGGWKEEVAFSRQMVVWCLIKLDRSIQEIAGEAESCFNYNSANAEAMYYLLSHCRVKGYYKYGYEIGKRIQGVKPPKTFLFMDPTVYQHKILDELSICAYWVGQYKESYELCEKLLRMDCVPLRDKKRIEKNKSFSENK
jgi:tetratricopeptide (TPR) repeat protein